MDLNDLIVVLREIQVIERGNQHADNGCSFKLMCVAVLQASCALIGFDTPCMSRDRGWESNRNSKDKTRMKCYTV